MGCIERARRGRGLERALKARVETVLWEELQARAGQEAAAAPATPEGC
jgi:hypothetical protein